jgi:glyoxylase-like metal-dependent hydrolase (beta-lactamase superfamily II)
MKNSVFVIALAFVSCQQTSQKSEADSPPINLDHPWLKAERIMENVWRIGDNVYDNMYLIEGTDKALLIDNGIGAVDLTKFIRKITALPVLVVVTHGHPDHVGSSNQFQSVYAHPDDFDAIKYFSQEEMKQQMLQYLVQTPIADSLKFEVKDTLSTFGLNPVKDGYIFDLGNRQIEVIHTPGHTRGSICLLDKQERLIFTGDHVKEEVWLHMDEALSVAEYLQSLKKLQNRSTDFDKVLSGHGGSLEKTFIAGLITNAENIINGTCKGEEYETAVGNGLVCSYEGGRIVYVPTKLGSK